MTSSLTYMLACIKAIKLVAQANNDMESVRKGLIIKNRLFVTSLVSTFGLVAFFMQHRFLCHNLGLSFCIKPLFVVLTFDITAFSAFAFCEYVVALANMAFHVSIIMDFPTEHLVVAKGLRHLPVEGKED